MSVKLQFYFCSSFWCTKFTCISLGVQSPISSHSVIIFLSLTLFFWIQILTKLIYKSKELEGISFLSFKLLFLCDMIGSRQLFHAILSSSLFLYHGILQLHFFHLVCGLTLFSRHFICKVCVDFIVLFPLYLRQVSLSMLLASVPGWYFMFCPFSWSLRKCRAQVFQNKLHRLDSPLRF